MAMTYGYIYVAQIAMGANDAHTLKAFLEAEAFDGPSLIIAYSHCISHGIDMSKGLDQQKLAVQSGLWPLFRFNPQLIERGENPLSLDSKAPSIDLDEYAYKEARYRMLLQSNEERAEELMKKAKQDVQSRWELYTQMAAIRYSSGNGKKNSAE